MFFWITLAMAALVVAIAAALSWKRVLRERERGRYRYDGGDAAVTVASTAGLTVPLFMLVHFFATMGTSIDAANDSAGDYEGWTENRERVGLSALALEGHEYTNSSGGFFLLMGGYSSESGEYSNIQYIRKDADGGMRVESTSLEGARVFEEPVGTQPYMEVITFSRDMTGVYPWWHEQVGALELYEFHVPEGAVVQSYSVDITKD